LTVPFDSSNPVATSVASPLSHVAALIEYLSSLLVESTRSYPQYFRWRCDFKEVLLFRAKQWYFIKLGTSPFVCTFVLGASQAWEHVPMNRKELYLLYAADCQQTAYVTRNEHERLSWLDMAQSWIQLAQVSSASLESQLDKSRRNAA
jgi:hypothetical protein